MSAIAGRSIAPSSGADAVVNLIGILADSGRQRFDSVHDFGARAIAEATRKAGIGRLVHVSAIGADPNLESEYAKTKAAGETAVLETIPDATIFRPSIIFGPEDQFFNRFAGMAPFTPALPLIGGGHTRFQPVFVGDVARAFADAVEGKTTPGTVYELGGPEIKTFRECMELMLKEIDRKRLLVTVPWPIASLLASVAAVRARQAADAGSAPPAPRRQCRLGSGDRREAHARRPRHRADQPRRDPALLSRPLPPPRPVRAQARRRLREAYVESARLAPESASPVCLAKRGREDRCRSI